MTTNYNTYNEYVIRCKTCNNQIACHVHDFLIDVQNNLQTSSSREEATEKALNNTYFKLNNWCCRIAMTNPTCVFKNLHNIPVYHDTINSINFIGKLDTMTNNSLVDVNQQVDDKPFITPHSASHPTINVNENIKLKELNVSSTIKNLNPSDYKIVSILNGRTYMAR
jgi:DNA-directed RNA polymerase subunit N (RpoN/RPB10)